MNGDSQKIYDAVVENGKNIAVLQSEVITIRKTQKEQHLENVAAIQKITDHESTCNDSHSKHGNQLYLQWWLISVLVVGVLGTAWAAIR